MTKEKADYQVDRTYKRTEVDRLGSVAIFDLLAADMPQEALKEENSRGFPLTSIKAGFILERLNLVFGLLGYGWRYAHAPHHIEQAGGKNEVLVNVALQWRVGGPDDEVYCPPIHWGQTVAPEGIIAEGWYFRQDLKIWSEPVFATGGANTNRAGNVPLTDAFRSAVTNGITKIAARLGVGNAIYKGQNDAPVKKAPARRRQAKTKTGKPAVAKTAKAEAKAGKATAAKAEANGFQTLTSIQNAAKAAVAKLQVEGQAETKTVQQLAHKMSMLGLTMQTPRLLQVLVGEGSFSQARVMGVHNFLLSAKLAPENIEVINAAAWAESQKDNK